MNGYNAMKNNKSLRDDLYKKILNDIIRGQFNPGEKLVLERLAKKYAVSRTPVREAIFQLEREGYVIYEKNVGAIVRKHTFDEVQDIYEIISLLESNAVQIVATQGLSKNDIKQMRSIMSKMEKLAKKKNYSEYMLENNMYHSFFLDKCKNSTLKYVVEDLRRKVYHIASMGITVPANIRLYQKSHREIFNAVINCDANNAYICMRKHTQDQKKLLTEEMIKISLLKGPSLID